MPLAAARTPWHTAGVSTKVIAQQLADLRRRVAKLEGSSPKPSNGWEEIVGTSKGQSLDREAARLGAEWRAKENRRK
jgi:hypothetical protein